MLARSYWDARRPSGPMVGRPLLRRGVAGRPRLRGILRETDSTPAGHERVFFVPFPRISDQPLGALDPSNLSVWERFDTLCRCVVAAFLTSRRLRRDVRFCGVFTKPHTPDAPVTLALQESLEGRRLPGTPPHMYLELRGAELEMLYPEERWVAATLRKALVRHEASDLADSARTAGWHVEATDSLRHALQSLVGEAPDRTRVLLLDEGAEVEAQAELRLARADGRDRLLFVVGDHTGLDAPARTRLVEDFGARPVNLGPAPLLTSQCIVVLNYLADQVWTPLLQMPQDLPGAKLKGAPAPGQTPPIAGPAPTGSSTATLCWQLQAAASTLSGQRPHRTAATRSRLAQGLVARWPAAWHGPGCLRAQSSSRSAAGTSESTSGQDDGAAQRLWREVNHALVGLEIEDWACSRARRRQSGHPKVKNRELQEAVAEAGLGERVGIAFGASSGAARPDGEERVRRLRGLLRGVLARPDMLFADEALGVLGRLAHHHKLLLSERELDCFAAPLVRRALRLACPTDEEAVAELQRLRLESAAAPAPADGAMSRLAQELVPAWLEGAMAEGALEARLRLAMECWELHGPADDVMGAGLFAAVCMELGERAKARKALEALVDAGVDLRLCLQPLFLESLQLEGVLGLEQVQAEPGTMQSLVQRAAKLAQRCQAAGISFRRHGALLLRVGPDGHHVLAEGFNHAAMPLGPRGWDPAAATERTFLSDQEAAAAGLPFKRRKPRPAQRHAEMHCLLQLPRLAEARGAVVLVAELADVGPGLRWAEPCARGCMQVLMKYGVEKALFTDGVGGVQELPLRYVPDFDVPTATFAGTGRLRGDAISERACLDLAAKVRREVAGLPPLTLDELVSEGAAEAAALRARHPQNFRGRMLPLPRRKGAAAPAAVVAHLL